MSTASRTFSTLSSRSLSSKAWRDHFRAKNQALDSFPWDDSYRLTDSEKRAIGFSIAQFQLGEGSEGRRLLNRGAKWGATRRDLDFADSLQEFIREEQRHSRWLGRFMDLHRIPRLTHHWADGIFRRIRVLAGLETAVTVLVSAEVIAVPYYRALRDATRSELLKCICNQILSDEAEHLEYQGRTLGLIRRTASGWKWRIHSAFLEATIAVVWKENASVFRAGGYSYARFRDESFEAFADLRGAGAIALGTLTSVRARP